MTITAASPARLIVNPALTVVRASNDEIVVRLGGRSLTSRRLKDEGRRGVLGDILERFVGTNSVSAVAQDLSLEPAVVQEVVDALREQQVLLGESEAEAALVTLGLGLPDSSVLRTSTVAMIGHGSLVDSLTAQLRDLGLDVETFEEPGVAAFEDADLVIVASDTPNIGLFFDANEIALSLDRPWHAVFADGTELVIGPLFRPGYTGCFHDFDTMDESSRSLRLDYLYYKSALTGEAAGALPRFIADLAASYVTTSLLQHLGGRGSFLEGNVIRVDLERLEIVRDQLLQMPRCPACIQNRPHLRHPFI